MREAIPLGHFVLFAIGKAVAFILGMAVRCPADILEPVLVTGGFVGGAIGCLLPSEALVGEGSVVMPCIIFGMVGLFASCFRFSLTPIVIVLEIVGTESYSLILPAVLCGFTAATCSDHLFPALLEDILAQDGIDLEESLRRRLRRASRRMRQPEKLEIPGKSKSKCGKPKPKWTAPKSARRTGTARPGR
ncbi:unnamed protein product [Effrenium voratum]|nr:unnamed protein product [Effrenium voratum]